jgi:hypothetical protein
VRASHEGWSETEKRRASYRRTTARRLGTTRRDASDVTSSNDATPVTSSMQTTFRKNIKASSLGKILPVCAKKYHYMMVIAKNGNFFRLKSPKIKNHNIASRYYANESVKCPAITCHSTERWNFGKWCSGNLMDGWRSDAKNNETQFQFVKLTNLGERNKSLGGCPLCTSTLRQNVLQTQPPIKSWLCRSLINPIFFCTACVLHCVLFHMYTSMYVLQCVFLGIT